MGIWEIILTGIALSMDASAISMTNAMIHPDKKARLLEMAFWFGLFQGLMPVLGFFFGNMFYDVISRLGGVLVAVIFCAIGGKMLHDGLSHEEAEAAPKSLSHRLLLIQAVATSIDAFAIGVGFSAGKTNIFFASSVIAVTTFVLATVSVFIGRIFGDMLGKKAEVFGGVLLILLGIKSLF